ncbi:hypothetical protein C9374_010206 [Naegleria lovaniensis]|uniref:COX assembly mitochondrial protein n=1 Tax=Naegleria lovaniensis TaxID=51637 RepID=A0AA88KJS9_NAELO|nr:uncharacterized protein C9374_011570 [Naegleria lovaniensis]XP_044544376.1 uncharacterized protein C9374_010206 [Naegleria lovaniensis]KAG2373905.1 hypothetical protein C9374_011570 [Naegleria lovaniensis]KAG2375202.1 hypothetical protein C9374_010206 [Naegleria lovaniensis]
MQNQRERFHLNLDPAEIDAMSPEELKQKVPNQADEALKLRLKKYGMKQCKVESKNFADCSKDKLLSIAVKCKDELQALTDCITIYLNEDNMNKMRRAYLKGELVKKHNITDLRGELNRRLEERTKSTSTQENV